MNFTFMIILLIVLLLYISLKVNFKSYILMLLLAILLVLYEIYNHQDYNLDKFYNEDQRVFDENYKFNKNVNPYSITRNEFRKFKIPYKSDLYVGNEKVKDNLAYGLPCEVEKEVNTYKLKLDKLAKQRNHVNLLKNYKPFNEPSLNEEAMDLSVFNPLEESEVSKVQCPSVCHLIDTKDSGKKCTEAKYIPVMENKDEYISKLKSKMRTCKNKRTAALCNRDTNCTWDEDYRKCEYDKRACLYRANEMADSNNIYKPPECYKRCEFMVTPGKINKSKFDCQSAVLYDGINPEPRRYCRWDPRNNTCKAMCGLYNGTQVCDSDPNCRIESGTGNCINR